MREDFKIGRQPCDNFNPQDGSYPGIINEHSCYKCGILTVSFCLSCNRDHHYRGYDLCDKIQLSQQRSEWCGLI